jgi:hypothetical protein
VVNEELEDSEDGDIEKTLDEVLEVEPVDVVEELDELLDEELTLDDDEPLSLQFLHPNWKYTCGG